MTEYRIVFTIQRAPEFGGDYEDIGFGSSGSWGSIDQAAHILESTVTHGQWETQDGMPDPDDVLAEIAAARDA